MQLLLRRPLDYIRVAEKKGMRGRGEGEGEERRRRGVERREEEWRGGGEGEESRGKEKWREKRGEGGIHRRL